MTPSPRTGRLRQALAFLLLAGLGGLALSLSGSARLERADFTFNNGAEVQTLDPATVSGVPEGRVVRLLFEGLCVKHPETLEPLPGVAESWDLSPDRRTYTFHLREDARWSDGSPVDARDFEFSWRRILHPETAAEYAYQLWYVRGARQYTLLDDSIEALPEAGLWLREEAPGRVRVGALGHALEVADPEGALRVLARVGEALRPGADLLEAPGLPGVHGRLPLAARVTALNPALDPGGSSTGSTRPVARVLADPCGDGWLAELEAAPTDLAALRDAGRLVPGARYRAELVEPELLGLRAADERTFVVTLEEPTPYFLDLCAFYPVFPVSRRQLEAARERWPNDWRLRWMRPENLVCNGPYRIDFRRVNDRIRFVRNELYWDAERVAFETIDALAIDHLGTSLNLYLMGEVDWIDRPITSVIPRLMGREDFEPGPYLGSYFYRVNCTKPPFDDPRVRRALALTIDREAIVTNITKAGEKPSFGFCPPGMGDYRRGEMRRGPDLAADVAEARALLAEAGFRVPGAADGAPFPTFEIHYNTDQTHGDIAEVVAAGWKEHLGLNVKLLNQEWKVYLDTQKSLDYDVTRSAWIGDYPDPNTFLDMFVTGGENNRTGWGDPRYDDLIARAAREGDEQRRLSLFAEAEALLLEELPILPIYDYVTRNLVNPRLGGFHANVQDEHFAKFWYWRSDEELAARRAALPRGTRLVPAPGPAQGLHPAAGRAED